MICVYYAFAGKQKARKDIFHRSVDASATAIRPVRIRSFDWCLYILQIYLIKSHCIIFCVQACALFVAFRSWRRSLDLAQATTLPHVEVTSLSFMRAGSADCWVSWDIVMYHINKCMDVKSIPGY